MAANKLSSSVALFLVLNLVLCNMAFSHYPPLDSCPKDTLKLKVCLDVLHLIKLGVGVPKDHECCTLIGGLISADVAACLCTAVHLDLLGLVHLNIPVDLTLLVNQCGCHLPSDFYCPPRLV